MSTTKTPSLVVVVIIASRQQWFVAGIPLEDGELVPLVRSEPNNLDAYVGAEPDEQVSFLRHRLCGAIQRGFDRLWARNAKASRIVLIADEDLPDSTAELLPDLAEHLDVWMTRPPISFFRGMGTEQIESLDDLQCLVGELDSAEQAKLAAALPNLKSQLASADWEVIQKPTE